MLNSTQPAVVKKYSCMYTTDLLKHRKVWHDGFIRIRHINSKLILTTEDGHTLAESFLKASLMNRVKGTNKNVEEELLSFMKVPAEFELEEDQEIEFDPSEDSESRPSSYMARIVTLIKIETETVPVMNSLNSKEKQELHKRKMEILDETIYQLSKRPKTNAQMMSTPFSGSTISPSSPIPSTSTKRKLAVGFQTRPFNSPLMNKSKSINQSSKLTPIKFINNLDETNTPNIQPELKPDHSKLNESSVISQPIIEPIGPLFSNLENPISSSSIHKQLAIKNNQNLKLKQKSFNEINPLSSNDFESNQKQPSSSSSSIEVNNSIDRISKKKSIKINWDSYFKPTT